jgi:hypothetical protein
MDLEQFVQITLEQIIRGVKGAHLCAAEQAASINSSGTSQVIEFDVAVTTTEDGQKKGAAGLLVLGMGIGGQITSGTSASSISRVKFSVPVNLPVQLKASGPRALPLPSAPPARPPRP